MSRVLCARARTSCIILEIFVCPADSLHAVAELAAQLNWQAWLSLLSLVESGPTELARNPQKAKLGWEWRWQFPESRLQVPEPSDVTCHHHTMSDL